MRVTPSRGGVEDVGLSRPRSPPSLEVFRDVGSGSGGTVDLADEGVGDVGDVGEVGDAGDVGEAAAES